MPRTTRTPQKIAVTGTVTTYSAVDAANGETIPLVKQDMTLEVVNADSSPHNVTIHIARTVDGVTPDPIVAAVTNATRKKFGPFPARDFQQADGGVWVDYASATGMTAAVFYS